MYLPCGKCLACRINRTQDWSTRLLHESYYSSSTYFLTLTYDEEHVPHDEKGNVCVCKEDIQLFMKRLRKMYPDSHIRYFIGSEYGEEGRPHYHGIFYNIPDEAIQSMSKNYIKGMPTKIKGKVGYSLCNRKLSDIWTKGFVTIGEFVPARANYVAGYFVNKPSVPEGHQPNFSLMSRKPGIGASYVDCVSEKIRYNDSNVVFGANSKLVPLPRYYNKKVYSDDERKDRLNSRILEIQERAEKFYQEHFDLIALDDARVKFMQMQQSKRKI